MEFESGDRQRLLCVIGNLTADEAPYKAELHSLLLAKLLVIACLDRYLCLCLECDREVFDYRTRSGLSIVRCRSRISL